MGGPGTTTPTNNENLTNYNLNGVNNGNPSFPTFGGPGNTAPNGSGPNYTLGGPGTGTPSYLTQPTLTPTNGQNSNGSFPTGPSTLNP